MPVSRQPKPDKRGPIKRKHELFHVNKFVEWHSRVFRSRFLVVATPDPPDAIIQSGQTTRWVEVGSVFWNDDWAHHLNSRATPGETDRPIGKGLYLDMDEQLADRFVAVLQDKLAKRSYLPFAQQHGPGYLVLPVMSPFAFDRHTKHLIRQKWNSSPRTDIGCFRGVFLSLPVGGIRRWMA
ncbi:hypothetical protein [Mesorhizobium sp. B2-6-1]|uniref:hypothetical protein n=1 Tax=Mesorhizobium sp. B2-6-1 TaxID=2589916 RepID=UPI0011290EF9|nr:hypothetical protein [Mesorhizobium sp. B2-6-1]TPJ59959.1 hypothetical protein FJ443_22465 [Mesorhizobium sp. B2-6-1]